MSTPDSADHENIETVDYEKPPYDGTRLRALRVDDELWHLALAIAAIREESVSEVVRSHLRWYVARHRHLLEDETEREVAPLRE